MKQSTPPPSINGNAFEPGKEVLFTITIEVSTNLNMFRVTWPEGIPKEKRHDVTTQEVIGALETVKSSFLHHHWVNLEKRGIREDPAGGAIPNPVVNDTINEKNQTDGGSEGPKPE